MMDEFEKRKRRDGLKREMRQIKERLMMGKCLSLPCFTCTPLASSSCSIQEGGGSIVRYSYKTLRSAAQGFQPSSKIGEGGFGSVYKGKLGNGDVVAIKVLSEKSVEGEKEFMAEIESMKIARHENLLRLRGYCIEGSNRVLVFDYIERNSLAQTLLSGRHCDIKFTWPVRRKISLGIARGLAYLHEEVKPRIIHRDIKPSNILIDYDLRPKISDFGLAKLFPDTLTHLSTRVAGTIGYLAPEYARCGKLTRKSDVYSFGVLLMHIICGRSATSYALGLEDYNIVEKVWELYKDDRLLELVDPSISNSLEHIEEVEAEQFLKVALLCVQEPPTLRPPMSWVVEMLATKMDTRGLQILQPGLITDLKSLKINGETTKVVMNESSRLASGEPRSSSLSMIHKYSSESSSPSSR